MKIEKQKPISIGKQLIKKGRLTFQQNNNFVQQILQSITKYESHGE